MSFAQVKDLLQPAPCGGRIIRGADNRDHLIDVKDGNEEAINEMEVLRCLIQPELRPAPHHVDAVVKKDLQQVLESEGARLTVYERYVIDAKRVLQRREPGRAGPALPQD